MKTLLPLLKTKLFLLGFVSACTVILATTVPQIRNFIAPEKAIGEKITAEQKKITPKINKQSKTVSASKVTSGVSLDMDNTFGATVTSDASDYFPLSTATFTGEGFSPNEDVVLKVKNLTQPCNTVSADSSYFPWTVTADNDGHFVTTWTVCNCPGDSLRLRAVGQTSKDTAYAYFTDGNVRFSTTGLPSNLNVTVNYSTPGSGLGSSILFSTGISGNANSTNISPTPTNGADFYFAFPTPIVVGSDTYDLISTSTSSPFVVVSSATTIIGNYQIAGGSGGLTVTAPTCAQGGSFEITYTPATGPDVTETKTTPFSFTAKKNTEYTITSIQSTVNGNTYIGPATATDETPNENDYEIEVILEYADNTAPTISNCPTNITVNTGPGRATCDQVASWTAPTATDNCGVTTSSNNYNSGHTFSLGITTVNYVFGDAAGNSSTCSFTVTVVDNTPPTINCPANTTLALDGDCEAALGNYIAGATANDGCSSTTITQSPAPGTPVSGTGGITVTLTARDASNNTNTCSFTVTKVDNTPPTINCPANTTLALDGDCEAALGNYIAGATANDGCSSTTITQSPAPGTPVSGTGGITVTLTARDASNNTNTCSFTVTKVDNTPPTINCPANTTLALDGDCEAALGNYIAGATANDGCSSTTITQSPAPGTPVSGTGGITVTLTARDASNNTNTCSFTVTKVDNTPPTINCPANTTLALDGDCEAALGNYIAGATANDGCSSTTITQSPAPGTPVSGTGGITVTLTARDASNNTNTCSFTLTKVDNTPPTINCPANTTLALDGDCEAALGNYIAGATANDGCSSTTITQSPAPGTPVSGTGGITVTLTARDASNNTNTCSFTVTKVDNTPPTINCPANTTLALDGDCEAALGNYIAGATANDGCSSTTITQSPAPGTPVSGTGGITVTLTARDASNNTNTCSFTVTKVDNTPPTINCPANTTLALDGDCEAALGNYIAGATANDGCSSTTITQSPAPGTPVSGTGGITVTLTARDASNNTNTCSFTVTKMDNTPPTINCPANTTLALDGDCEAALGNYIAGATANDGCSSTTITQSPAPGTPVSGTGGITVTLTARDASNNTNTCSFTVTKVDNTPPTINCPANTTLALDGDCEAALGNYIAGATANDGCSSTTITQSPAPGTPVSGTGGITVTLTARDASNNTNTCSFTVTKVDNTPPTINCPANTTLALDGDCEAALGNYIAGATANDGCSSTTITQSPAPGTPVSGTGGITVTLTARDASNNTNTCSFTLTKVDNTPPTINCPANTTLALDGDCEAALGNYIAGATANDGCSSTTITQSPAPGTPVSGTGGITVTLTARDASNNTNTCSFTVTKVDNTPPTINCPANTTLALDGDCEAALGNYIAGATANDGCSSTTITQSPAPGTPVSGTGGITVTLTARDASNNTNTCSFTVNKVDVTAPTFTTMNSNTTLECNPSAAAIEAALGTATAMDACSTPTVTKSDVETGTCAKSKTRTFTARDASGNTSTASVTVTWSSDVTPPTTSITLNKTCLWPPNHKMVDIFITPTSSDNCGLLPTGTDAIQITSNELENDIGDGNTEHDWEIVNSTWIRLRAERSGISDQDVGRIYTVKYTVTDGCGNTASSFATVTVAHNITNPNPGNAYPINTTVNFAGTFWDVPGKTHTAKWVVDGTTVNGTVTAEPSGNKMGKVTGSFKPTVAGVYKLRMNVIDQSGVTGYSTTSGDYEAYFVAYDPKGGFTYGGGQFISPAGALPARPNLTDAVTFGFTSNFYKNATNPKGETQADFKLTDGEYSFAFNALNYDYLSVNGSKAVYKGLGKTIINGVEQSGYAFILSVIDGKNETNPSGVDKIRLKIYNKNTGAVIYDNQMGDPETAEPTMAVDIPLADGSDIVVVSTPTTSADITAQNSQMEVTTDLTKFNVRAFPNPSEHVFSLVLENATNEKVQITVYDAMGRKVKMFEKQSGNIPIHFGMDLKVGAYIVEVKQGDNRKTLKLVKQ